MNMLVFERDELAPDGTSLPLPRNDRRYEHIKKVLHKRPGDRVEAGIVTDDPFGSAPLAAGEAAIVSLEEKALILRYKGLSEPEPLAPIRLLLGFPRPIQATRIFKDLVSLGLAEIILTGTDLGEKSYLESDFFSQKEYRRPMLDGAEQAANPRLPRIRQYWSLRNCIEALDSADGLCVQWKSGRFIALHPGAGIPSLGHLMSEYRPYTQQNVSAPEALPVPLTLAIGSERGWTEDEIAFLINSGFETASLGSRILKTETAAASAITLALAAMGRM